jgi:hypothetical protein
VVLYYGTRWCCRTTHLDPLIELRVRDSWTGHAQNERARHNVTVPDTGQRLQLVTPDTSPEEAAAIVAALERFMRATAAPAGAPRTNDLDGWRRAALLEGVSRTPDGNADAADVSWMFPTPG